LSGGKYGIVSRLHPVVYYSKPPDTTPFQGNTEVHLMDEFTPTQTKFLTPKQFMEARNLTRNTVYEGIKNGTIPSVRISKRKILIPEDALERLLQGHPEE